MQTFAKLLDGYFCKCHLCRLGPIKSGSGEGKGLNGSCTHYFQAIEKQLNFPDLLLLMPLQLLQERKKDKKRRFIRQKNKRNVGRYSKPPTVCWRVAPGTDCIQNTGALGLQFGLPQGEFWSLKPLAIPLPICLEFRWV